MSYALLAVGVGTAAYSIISGVSKNSKAKKIARSNKRPAYKIPQGIIDNQRLLEARASRGLSGASINLYNKSSDRQTTSSIDAILKGGGSVSNIGDLYSHVNEGVDRMALIDDEMRARNVQGLVSQNNVLADHQDKEWQVNYWGPYADNAQAAAKLKEQGANDINKGITSLGSAVAGYAGGANYGSLASGVFGKKSSESEYAGEGNVRDSSGRNYRDYVPEKAHSSVLEKTTDRTPAYLRYPGLAGTRGYRRGVASLDPVWDDQSQTYVDPLTGNPL